MSSQDRRMDTSQSSRAMTIFEKVNTVTHLLLGAVALSAVIFANGFSSGNSLSQHIYLCVIGYIILMSMAIMSFSPYTSWSRSLDYNGKKISHLVLQIAGSALAVSGSIVRMIDVDDNFQSSHGVLGLIAMILTLISLVGGAINLLALTDGKRMVFKTLHSCCGTVTIIMAFITLCLGFNSRFYRLTFGDTNSNLSITLTSLALVGVILSPCMHIIKRFM